MQHVSISLPSVCYALSRGVLENNVIALCWYAQYACVELSFWGAGATVRIADPTHTHRLASLILLSLIYTWLGDRMRTQAYIRYYSSLTCFTPTPECPISICSPISLWEILSSPTHCWWTAQLTYIPLTNALPERFSAMPYMSTGQLSGVYMTLKQCTHHFITEHPMPEYMTQSCILQIHDCDQIRDNIRQLVQANFTNSTILEIHK